MTLQIGAVYHIPDNPNICIWTINPVKGNLVLKELAIRTCRMYGLVPKVSHCFGALYTGSLVNNRVLGDCHATMPGTRIQASSSCRLTSLWAQGGHALLMC